MSEVAANKIKITDEVREVGKLKADAKNARRHSEQQIAQIAGAIERFGYVNKIAIRPDGTIIGGHATLEACKRIGHEKIEVRVVAGLTPAQYRALGLALNKLPENSSWDDDVLSEVLGEIGAEGEDLQGLGFSDKDLGKLMGEPDDIEVKEIETSTVDDEFWVSVRGPLADQAKALKALEQVMKAFPAVTVELGTIALGS